MLPDVFALLNVAAVQAFVGNPPRIYRHGTAPQDVAAPYLTWFAVDGIPENLLDGTPTDDAFHMQVDCWSNNTGTGAAEVNALALAVRDQIETAHYVTAFGMDQQDYPTQRYRLMLTFTIWAPRPS